MEGCHLHLVVYLGCLIGLSTGRSLVRGNQPQGARSFPRFDKDSLQLEQDLVRR
jgi:hypothetical protein